MLPPKIYLRRAGTDGSGALNEFGPVKRTSSEIMLVILLLAD